MTPSLWWPFDALRVALLAGVERHPDHTYAAPGIYEVCLTVSNDLGTDTHCRTLDLGPVSVSNPPEISDYYFSKSGSRCTGI